jgi:glycine cleavage system H lipoate-binding protein
MVVIFVILTIALFVTVDYFIQKRKNIGYASEPKSISLPLSQVLQMIPKGVFLQPSFTWSKIQENGNLAIGLNPMLLGIVGEPDDITLISNSQQVKKGDPLFQIRKGEKKLAIKSPVDGIIMNLNSQVLQNPSWESVSQNWLYTIKPENVAQEIPLWYIAENAKNWVNEKYKQVKEFFMESLPQTQLGVTMADGGDLPTGILAHFDQGVWDKFQNQVIQ